MNDLISIIVPAYNVESYLGRCLESIFSQTYPYIEVIVVDDGSTDKTSEVIEKYKDQHPVQMKSIQTLNSGPASARLKGVSIAKGKWIGFVDSDDEIESYMYEFLLHNAKLYHADISHCGYQLVLPEGNINYFYNTGRLIQQDKITGLKDLLEGSFVEPGLWNKLFRKSLFHKLLKYDVMDTSIKINEDLLMNYYLFSEANKMIYEDCCLYHYFARKNSATRSDLNEKKIFDPIRVKEIIRRSAPIEIKEDAQRAYLNVCISTFNGLIQSGSDHKKDAEEVRTLLKKEKMTFSILGTKRTIMAKMIVSTPLIYKLFYNLYCHLVHNNPYE